MDKSTQQNAAMVEEMNAASANLAEEARHLAETLRRFKTSHAKNRQESGAGHRQNYAA
jgi:methyl-accepting chemotaxis protein